MSRLEQHVAKVRCNSAGEWKLFVSGTDICQLLYRKRHPDLERFPGPEMGHRLIELGWMPDRRAAIVPTDTSVAEKMLATMRAGWMPSGGEDEWVWTMPVYREVE